MATSCFAVSLVLLEFHCAPCPVFIFCAEVAANPRLGLRVIRDPSNRFLRVLYRQEAVFFFMCFILGDGHLGFLLQNQETWASLLGLRLGRDQIIIEKTNISINSSTDLVGERATGWPRV